MQDEDQSEHDLKYLFQFTQMQVYMPQFHVAKKMHQLAYDWTTLAQQIINIVPRIKNLIVTHKMPDFLNHLHKI